MYGVVGRREYRLEAYATLTGCRSVSMSYIALATNAFEKVTHFYGAMLGFPIIAEWDRADGRGCRFSLGDGLRLEILDNTRERRPLSLYEPGERIHIVIEVPDITAARGRLAINAPEPETVSWGARLFRLQDPDGIPVTFLQWDQTLPEFRRDF